MEEFETKEGYTKNEEDIRENKKEEEKGKWAPMMVNGEKVTPEQVEYLKSIDIIIGWEREVLDGYLYNVSGRTKYFMRICGIKFMLSKESHLEIWDKMERLGVLRRHKGVKKEIDEAMLYINDEQVGACESIKTLAFYKMRGCVYAPLYIAELKNFDYNDRFLVLIRGWYEKKINLVVKDLVTMKRHILLGCKGFSSESEFPREDYYSDLFKFEFETREVTEQ